MANLKTFLIVLIFSTFLVLASETCRGNDWKLLDVDAVSFETSKIKHKYHAYFPDQRQEGDWLWGMAINWDLRALRYMYWKNRAYFDYDTQARHVGWKFEYGLNIGPYLDTFWQHHSQHMMESSRDDDRFPLDDRYGIRLHFIK